MRLHLAGLLALALAACEPKGLQLSETAAPPAAPATATAADCAVDVTKDWINEETPQSLSSGRPSAGPGGRYTAEAHTLGPACQQAVAVLIIRAREGSPIYAWSGPAEHIFGLKDAADPAAMKTALEDWIGQSGSLRTTENLPPWEETEGQPKRAEFPFMPEDWIDQQTWNTLRAEKRNLFCFPQGGESLRCAVLRDGQMEEIGLQLFPG